jgi:riboflavin synthase
MFTGIIQGVGEVDSFETAGEKARIVLKVGDLAGRVSPGDSVSVSGVCLTAVNIQGTRIHFDAVKTTLAKTTLNQLRRRDHVNLETALRVGDPLGGHLVYGHVDGVGTLRSLNKKTGEVRIRIDAPEEVLSYLVERGSVAVDGISLTVASVHADGFEIAVIPYTLAETTLKDAHKGDRVNLEADMIGRWVKKYLDRMKGARGITLERLRDEGY